MAEPTVELVEPADGLEEHERAGASNHLDAVVLAPPDGFVGHRAGAEALEQPHSLDAELYALVDDVERSDWVDDDDDAFELGWNRREVGVARITADRLGT